MAIGMILLMSGIGVMTMQYIRLSAHHHIDSYHKEQAQIFMRSLIEAAILKIHEQNRSQDGCLESFTMSNSKSDKNKTFIGRVKIEKYYLYKGKDNDKNTPSCSNIESIDYSPSHGYVIIEVVVESNQSHPKMRGTTPIRIVTRSVQHP